MDAVLTVFCVKCWTYGVGLGVVGSVYISSDSKAIHFLSYITTSFSLAQHWKSKIIIAFSSAITIQTYCHQFAIIQQYCTQKSKSKKDTKIKSVTKKTLSSPSDQIIGYRDKKKYIEPYKIRRPPTARKHNQRKSRKNKGEKNRKQNRLQRRQACALNEPCDPINKSNHQKRKLKTIRVWKTAIETKGEKKAYKKKNIESPEEKE